MASTVFSETQASAFSPSPSSPLIPTDKTKRLSALLTPSGSSPTSAGEHLSGTYHNSQRNSSGTLLPSAQATMSKRQSTPPQGPTPSYDGQPVIVSDSRSDVSSTSSAMTTTPIIIPILAPSPVHSSSSSTLPCNASLVYNPALAPSPASSSPSTSAFRTPVSSFADPSSNPPSPSLTSTRPAPRSPAISRRGSGLSLGQSTRSRHQSGLAIEVIPSPMEMDPVPAFNMVTPTVSITESTPTVAAIPAAAAPASTPTPAATSFTEPLITVFDYGFAPTDDRFHGRGPFVPKFNRAPRLNATLAGEIYESDSDDAKQKEKAKKKKKKYTNGWSDSDTSDMDVEPSGGGFKGFGPFETSSSNSSGGGGVGNRVIPTENAVEDEEEVDRALPSPAGGWGMLGFGMDWLASSTSFSRDGLGGGGGGGARVTSYPSQMELERNFGQGAAELEDYSGDGDAEDGEEPPYLFDQDYSDLDHLPIVDSPLPPGSYRALYVFEAVGDAEMGLVEGQIVNVVGKERGDGWAVVNDTREGREGRHALVPESYLELVQLAD